MKINDSLFLSELCKHYNFNINNYIGYKAISKGHINTTYTLYFDYKNHVKRYLLQEINNNVFTDPKKLMDNISGVCEHLKQKAKKKKNKILRIYKTKDKKNYITLSDGSIYRVYHYVENAITFDFTNNKKIFYEAGKIIGLFSEKLSDYDTNKLYETIKDFHNTEKRYDCFIKTLESADKNLKKECKDEINFFIENKSFAHLFNRLIKNKDIPLRVTHNDTKLNNLMFEYGSNKGLCLVDLDTIMQGTICFDYGDFVRSACNPTFEDEKDLSTVVFQKELCIEFSKGFIEKMNNLTLIEAKNLINGAIVMCYECGMRFLTDYLSNNQYFKIDYPKQNLYRCKTQIHLCKQIIENKKELDKIILSLYNKKITN